MGHVMCVLFGHQKARVVFSSNRFYCPRCRKDLGMAESLPTGDPSPSLSKTTVRRHIKALAHPLTMAADDSGASRGAYDVAARESPVAASKT